MKNFIIVKVGLLFAAFMLNCGMARSEDYVLDFSTKLGKGGSYDNSWIWPENNGVEWELKGAQNTNGAESFVRFGGKDPKKSVSYIKSKQPFPVAVSEMVLDVQGLDQEIKTFKLYVAKDVAFEEIVEMISKTAVKGQIIFLPEKEEVWLSGLYYKLEVYWDKSTTNKTAKINSLTFKEGVPPPVYNITASVNDETLGAVSLNEKTITALLEKCSAYAEPAYTVLEGEAEVTQVGNTFAIVPQSDCLIQINFVPLETYSVWLDAGNGRLPGAEELLQTECSVPVVLPEADANCTGWTFAGWAEAPVEKTEIRPDLLSAGEFLPEEDIILYAVYKKQEQGENATGQLKMQLGATAGWEILVDKMGGGTTVERYYILHEGASILSPAFDLSVITSITAKVRSYQSKNTMVVTDEAGNEWGTVTAGKNELASVRGVKKQDLVGYGRLKFIGSDITENHGVGVAAITISYNTLPTIYHSNPICEPGAGTGFRVPSSNHAFYVEGNTIYFQASEVERITVHDLCGRLIYCPIAGGMQSLTLTAGVYLLQVGEYTGKLVLK